MQLKFFDYFLQKLYNIKHLASVIDYRFLVVDKYKIYLQIQIH